MNIVSGISRSGTSLMMHCIKEAGLKVEHTTVKKNDMNPNGFFETIYAVQGVRYHLGRVIPKGITKVVGRGLWQSDPAHIDKIIYMIRKPADIAKSQERLKRQLPFEGLLHHGVEMYVNVTILVARWLIENPKEILLVEYDKLIDEPEIQLARVQEFLGKGDFSNPPIDKSLSRSHSDTKWEQADRIYDNFMEGNYEAIANEWVDKNIKCERMARVVTPSECRACKDGGATKNFMKVGDWSRRCMRDVIEEQRKDNQTVSTG